MSFASALAASQVPTVPALVGLLVDKSGSMQPYEAAVKNSINQLVATQQKLKGVGQLALAEFSYSYNSIFNEEFSKINPKFAYDYHPDGGTCLYNSIKRMTADFELQIEGMKKKPKRIVIAILTDGEDTGCETTAETIKELIEKKRSEGWEYMFLGALQEALRIADNIGIPKEQAAAIDSNNIAGSIKFINQKISESRKGKRLMITDAERSTLGLPPAKNEL